MGEWLLLVEPGSKPHGLRANMATWIMEVVVFFMG